MAKRVKLPANSWPHSELGEDKVVGQLEVAEDVLVVRAGLICRDHATVHNLELAILYECLDFCLLSTCQFSVVTLEECDVSHGVGVGRVF